MRGRIFVSNAAASTASNSSKAAELPAAKISSPWQFTTQPVRLLVNVIGTTSACSYPAFSMAAITASPQHLLASRVPYIAIFRRQQCPSGANPFGGTTATCPVDGAWKKATRMSYRAIRLSCCPRAFVRVAARETIMRELFSGGVAWVTSSRTYRLTSVATSRERTAWGSSGVGFTSSSHFAETNFSPRRFASAFGMTSLTPNFSMLSSSFCRPWRTFSRSNRRPLLTP